jgi:hypothetical protein
MSVCVDAVADQQSPSGKPETEDIELTTPWSEGESIPSRSAGILGNVCF